MTTICNPYLYPANQDTNKIYGLCMSMPVSAFFVYNINIKMQAKISSLRGNVMVEGPANLSKNI